ncbi:ESPR-type extended signal peptide-containing protein [uncultured Megasphaera sp.]|uniref:ESPR-type extended signal peptide-containing protein n=2 Tax=uncultured Megasphaera sp. TaxID=165188 RepID=UPI0025F74815|nr:ESPR-type extended signal peptide-containing protein [uncultured Megasphaera sp.]
MNKIYRVIWSRVKHCYVVVSEMANSRTKSNGSHVVKKTALATMVLAGLSFSGMGMPSYAADNIIVDSGTAAGTTNTVTDDTTVRVVGTGNTVTTSNDAEILGDGNTVTNSKSQTVIGDKNSITGRNSGTVSGKQEIRTDTVSDLLIGKGNQISGNYTYMKGYESLTLIGNNNTISAPESGIVIGDNQNTRTLRDAVIIGSMTPDEKAGADYTQFAEKSVIVGYHAQGINYGIAVGYGAKALGKETTVTGHNSVSDKNTDYSSIYGINNKIGSGDDISMANGIVGTFNKVDSSSNSMVFGSGNRVTNAVGDMTVGMGAKPSDINMYVLVGHSGYGYGYTDYVSELMGEYASVNGGSVFAVGNSNISDYARDSSVIGTANILNGTATAASAYNTIAGYRNSGTNVSNVSVIGTGNKLSSETTDVVIGDYHELSGGSNNVILGSMAVKEETVTRTYTPKLKDPDTGVEYEDDPITYTFTVKTPVKAHTENISNAVMLGYNTDVTKSGGVALGAEAVASTAAGKAGYDPVTKENSTDTSAAWKSTLAAVSVGDSTDSANIKTRQITNVAAGTEDTDAVNVAQLKKVQTQLDANSVHYFSTKSAQTGSGTNYLNDGAAGTDSIVIGINSSSKGNNSTVLGNNVSVVGDKNEFNSSIVVGQNIDVDGTHNAVFATDYENGDHRVTKVFGEQNTVLGVGNLVGYTAVQNGNEWTYTKNDYGSDQNVAVGLLNTVSGGSIAVGTSSEVQTLGTSFGHGNKIQGSMLEGGQWRVALGNYLTVKGEMGLAVGNAAKVDGDWAIAIGNNNHDEEKTTTVKGESSIAIGTATTVEGGWATAIGSYSEVNGKSATAVGSYSIAAGERATAFGNVAQAKAAYSLAVGAFSTAEAGQSVAIGGVNAKATANHSVALGSFSTADRAGGILGYDPLTKKESTSNTAAWKSVLGAVSVGGQVNYSDGTTGQATRQITNVAAGSDDTDAVNVAQLKQVQQSVSDAVKEGKTIIEAGDNVTVEKGSTDNSYKISAKDTTLKDSDSALSLDGNKLKLEIEDTAGNKVSGSVELDQIGSAIDTKNTIAKAEGGHIDFTTKANEYGGTEYSLSVVTDGKVEAGDTGIVTGDTVYNETRVAKDGEYVKQANSAGENLSILDSQVKANAESITNLSSNVTNLNSRVSSLDTRINRVGAGAAALAALHPQDYDPSAKWDFAAGYGNYKSANAVAIGAFYRPTNDVLFSIGTSMGGGENMFNAGVSFKFGSSNEYSNYSKASLAEVVSEQSKQLEAQHSTIEALQSKVEKQEQENQELRAQVQEIMRQLSAQR